MDQTADIRDLMRAANYIMIRKRLRSAGIGSIIFGLIAIYIGAITNSDIARLAITVIGIFLVAEGAWVLTSPSPAGILADSIGFAAVGLWNIAAILAANLSVLWAILGAIQIKWALDRYREYRVFSKLAAEKPTPESMALMESMVKDIIARDVAASPDIMEIRLKGVVWRALLLDRAVVFVAANGRGVFVQNREDVSLTLHPGAENAQVVTVSGDVTSQLPAEMPAEHYRRYLTWKGVPDQSPLPPAAEVGGSA